jgi:RsiW-degrading membrane proteinase PrsW (M82 family)
VAPAAFLVLVAGQRLDYEVPAGTLALTVLFGGVIGVVAAGVLEYDTLRRLSGFGMLGVGLIEESAKLIVPVGLLIWRRYRAPADGLVIGVAAGAGFAALETMGYAFVTLIASHGSISAVDGILLLRGVMSPAAHMAWTGLTAAALWRAADAHWHKLAVLQLLVTFALAVGLHTAWDTVGTTTGYAVIATIGLAALWRTARTLRCASVANVPAATPFLLPHASRV